MQNNDLSSDLWVLMDPLPGYPVKQGHVKIQSISWEGYSDPNHHVLLKSKSGGILFESYGTTDLSPIGKDFGLGLWVEDLELVDLESGRVLVAVK